MLPIIGKSRVFKYRAWRFGMYTYLNAKAMHCKCPTNRTLSTDRECSSRTLCGARRGSSAEYSVNAAQGISRWKNFLLLVCVIGMVNCLNAECAAVPVVGVLAFNNARHACWEIGN